MHRHTSLCCIFSVEMMCVFEKADLCLQVTALNSKSYRTDKPIQAYRTIMYPKLISHMTQSNKWKNWRVKEGLRHWSFAVGQHAWPGTTVSDG